MAKKEIKETVNRFNQIMGYSPEEGIITERRERVVYQDYAEDDEEGGNTDFDFGDEGNPEDEGGDMPTGDAGAEASEEGGEFDFGAEETEEMDFGGEGSEIEDEFGTADEFSAADDVEAMEDDVEEIDVTAIVDKSEEAKEAAELAVSASQENSQYLKSMTDTISNLSNQLTKMDTILNRVTKLERDIKTPEEKLELRSLDSYPFNLKLTDYWEDKAAEDDNYNITGGESTVNGQTKEYTISKEDVDGYNEAEIATSFNPESDEDVTIYKRTQQY